MNYVVKNIDDKFCVYETPTEQIFKTFYNESEAKTLKRHLNFGGGFDGNTPSFFLKKFELNYQID
jgi:hypothetical protein